MFSTRTLASAFVFGGAFAAGLSLSSQCQSTLLTVASSPDSACLNVGGLAGLLTAGSNTSLVPTVGTWLSGACSQDPCTNSSLASIVQNITSGCSDDLSSLGISNSSSTTDTVTQAVQEAYPTVRDIGCLKVESNNTLCVTDLLNDVEASEGTLSVDNILSMLPSLLTGQLTSLPSSVTCNDCVASMFSTLQKDQPSLANSTVQDALESQCGSGFLSATPTGISEATGSAAIDASNTSGSLTGFVSRDSLVGLSLASLVAISSGFLVLA